MNTPNTLKCLITLLTAGLLACGGAGSGSTSSSSGSTGTQVLLAGGGSGIGPVVDNDGSACGIGSGCAPISLCSPAHQQLLDLQISDIYRLDANNVRLPDTAAELSVQQTGTVTVGTNTYNVAWLKVWFNQLFFPTAALGSEFTRISYDITKVDAKYQVWSQSLPTGFLKYAFLEDVIAHPTGFQPITSVGSVGGLDLVNNPTTYARLLDNQSFPLHSFANPTPALNWVSSSANRKIVVVQVCDGDFEDSTAPVNPNTGIRDLIKGKSQPILLELSED